MKYAIKLNEEVSFDQIVQQVDFYGVGFIAVVDDLGYLVGVVSDGDIRRALMRDDRSINNLINRNPETISSSASIQQVCHRLKKIHRRHIPVVNQDGILERVFLLDDIDFNLKENTVVIMAGGLGTRLGDLTKDKPKPMVHLAGRPMLEHTIELLRNQGFYKFKLCVNYKKEKIIEYFKDGASFGVEIDYVEEQKRLGTAGALSLINEHFDAPLVVMNADIVTNLDFSELVQFHEKYNQDITTCVRTYTCQIPFGVISTDGNNHIKDIEEKPELQFLVSAGIYILNPCLLSNTRKDQDLDMPEFIKNAIESGRKCGVFEITGYWADLGRREDIEKAETDILNSN